MFGDGMPDAELSIGERMARLGEGSSRREGSPGRTESPDVEGYQMVELVRPTPDTKLGLTFGEFRGQVVIHQVFAGYPAEMLHAGDVVHSLNGTPVTAEAAATLLASEAGERLTLRLLPPQGASIVCFAKADAAQEVQGACGARLVYYCYSLLSLNGSLCRQTSSSSMPVRSYPYP